MAGAATYVIEIDNIGLSGKGRAAPGGARPGPLLPRAQQAAQRGGRHGADAHAPSVFSGRPIRLAARGKGGVECGCRATRRDSAGDAVDQVKAGAATPAFLLLDLAFRSVLTPLPQRAREARPPREDEVRDGGERGERAQDSEYIDVRHRRCLLFGKRRPRANRPAPTGIVSDLAQRSAEAARF